MPPARAVVERDLAALPGADVVTRRRWRRSKPARTFSSFSAETLNEGRIERVWLHIPIAPPAAPPAAFRVLAIVAAHNEQDVIEWCVRGLRSQGCDVIVIDHASSDDTRAIVAWLRHEGVVNELIDAPATWSWSRLLDLKATLADDRRPDWALHTDADEWRSSPWPDTTLREGLWAAQCAGADTVDFTIVNHLPVRSTPNGHPDAMPHVDFGLRPGYFRQEKAWAVDDRTVDLSSSGGHRAKRAGGRTLEINFRCDHYPVRSQAHGRHKILVDRRARWSADRVERPAQHGHYDHVTDHHDFEVAPGELPVCTLRWDVTNRARLLLRSGLTPSRDYRLV